MKFDFYLFTKPLWRGLLNCFYDIKVEGKENIPSYDSAIIAANHVSALDPLIIMSELEQKVTFLALKFNPFITLLEQAYGQIIIEKRHMLRTIKKALTILRKNSLLGVFPEGTRSYDGNLRRFKRGTALLANKAKVPVVPCAVIGTYKIWPRKKVFPRLSGKIFLRFGRPVYESNPKKLEKMVREEILRLGKPYQFA